MAAFGLDHIGVVAADLGRASRDYAVLRAAPVGDPVIDPEQRARTQFSALPDGTRIELIEPLGPESPVRRALEKGGGPNHLCWEVPELHGALVRLVEAGAICVCSPTPAVAFGGRKVAFVFCKGIGVVEFVESGDRPRVSPA